MSYNTDAHILRQVCKLLQSITMKYTLSDENRYKIADAKTIVMKLVRQIEHGDSKVQGHEDEE